MSRPRPVLIYGVTLAVLGVLTTSADAANLIPDSILLWLRLALAVVGAVGGAVFVQGKVTPLSDPRARDGVTPLVPADQAPLDATQDVSSLSARRRYEQGQ